MDNLMTFTMTRTVTVDVAELADNLALRFAQVLDENMGFDYDEIEAIDQIKILKEVAKYWLKTLDK